MEIIEWKFIYEEYIDFVLIRLFTAVFVQLISFRRNSFQSTHFYMKKSLALYYVACNTLKQATNSQEFLLQPIICKKQ